MSGSNIIISRESGGWYVTVHNKMGPYICREQAYNLASGMADAIRESGGDVELCVREGPADGEIEAGLSADPHVQPDAASERAPLAFGAGLLADALEPRTEGVSLRVLCAEDNYINQQVLKIFLDMAGMACTMVANGAEAVAAWVCEPWDIILMDIQMPVMDGLTAAGKIRALEAETGRTRTPILAVTANVMPDQIATYLAAGMDAVVSKPITAPLLLAEIGAALETPHGPLASAAPVCEARLAPLLA
jgi:CheY-like chemotaxis protein